MIIRREWEIKEDTMKHLKKAWRVVFFTTLLGSLSMMRPLYAQLTLGTITGRVMDPSGAIIPGCQIKIENIDTAVTRTAESDTTGVFTAPALSAGHYRIT